jgi:tRNA threonylcarbamoyladenosine biosynthesis protein TsaE
MRSACLTGLTLDDVDRLVEQMVRRLPDRLVFGLIGTLGAGKTTFVQRLAAAAGVDTADVTSPTFTLLSSYRGKIAAGAICLHHLDAYRVADEDEFLELGVEELFDSAHTWTLIEWADRVESVLPDDTLWIRLEVESSDEKQPLPDRMPPRTIRFETASEVIFAAVADVVSAVESRKA